MDATQIEASQQDDISFIVVLIGAKCIPVLVRRESFNSKVGTTSARKTYQPAYAPNQFPSATRVVPVSEDPLYESEDLVTRTL